MRSVARIGGIFAAVAWCVSGCGGGTEVGTKECTLAELRPEDREFVEQVQRSAEEAKSIADECMKLVKGDEGGAVAAPEAAPADDAELPKEGPCANVMLDRHERRLFEVVGAQSWGAGGCELVLHATADMDEYMFRWVAYDGDSVKIASHPQKLTMKEGDRERVRIPIPGRGLAMLATASY